MARYKGKYVATVEINFDFENSEFEDTDEYSVFEKIKDEIICEITPILQEFLKDEIDEIGTVEVRQNFADLYRVERFCNCRTHTSEELSSYTYNCCPYCGYEIDKLKHGR